MASSRPSSPSSWRRLAHRQRTLRNGALAGIAGAASSASPCCTCPPAILLGAAAIGMLGGRLRPDLFHAGGATAAAQPATAALIDDATADAATRRLQLARCGTTLVGVTLLLLGWPWRPRWAAPPDRWRKWGGLHQGPLMTFGGAYAVLPYVYQGAVEPFTGSTAQMMDGLALAKHARPLIMIVASSLSAGHQLAAAGVPPAGRARHDAHYSGGRADGNAAAAD